MADRIKGITIEIGGDTTGLSKALGGVNKEIRNTQSQLKDVERLLKLDPSNTELLSQKQKLLAQTVAETKDKIDTLKTAEKQAQQQFAEGKISQDQYDALKREIIDTEQKLKSLEDQAQKANVVLQQISVAGDKFQEFGGKVSDVGEKFLPVTAAVTALGAVAVKTTADFDTAMAKVSAISGATGDDFDKLREKAREMGAKTKFSASDAADAFQYMAMAGWKTEDMLNGIEGIMNLAAASGEELALTSDIVTDALTAFGLTAKDSAHFADILAAASSNSNTNVSMMGETFKYVAPLAGSLKYSAEDTAVAIGLMANSGIKASQAGTQLRAAITNMVKPTDSMIGVMDELGIEITNDDGSMKSLKETTEMLRSAFAVSTPEIRDQRLALYEQQMEADGLGSTLKGLTEEQKYFTTAMYAGTEKIKDMSEAEYKKLVQDNLGINIKKQKLTEQQKQNIALMVGTKAIEGLTEAEQAEAAATLFGKEAMSGMLAIINASESDYNKLTQAVENCNGSTEEMSNTMQDNLNGQLDELKSQLEELAISFGDILMPMIRNIVSSLQGFVEKLNGLDDSTKKTIATILLLAAAIGPVLLIVGKIIIGIGSLLKAISTIGTTFSALSTVFGAGSAAASGFGTAIAAITGPIGIVIAAVAALIAILVVLYQNNEDFRNKVQEIWSQINDIIGEVIENIKGIISVFVTFSTALWGQYGEDIMSVVSKAFGFISDFIMLAITAIRDVLNFVLALIKGDWSGAWEAMKTLVSNLFDGIKNIVSSGMDLIKSIIKLGTDIAKDTFDAFKEKVIEIFINLKEKVTEKVIEVKEAIINGIGEAVDWIKALPGQAIQWGKDFIDGFVSGIKEKMGAVTDGIKGVAENITSYIHFSRPDTGPLREYEKWMPDMVSGLAKGIKDNAWRITDQVKGLTGNMSYMLNGDASGAGGNDLTKIEGLLGYYLPGMSGGANIVLDDGALVGKMLPNIDSGLTNFKDTNGRNG